MGATARFRFVTALAVIALLLSSCGGGSSAASSAAVGASTPVTFTTSDGVKLAGRLFGPVGASAGVVLAHMLPADQQSWFAFAQRLADQGYRVLTFNFRGYCPGGDGGCSQGVKQIDAAPTDLAAAIDRLRADGVTRVGIAGASMGGTAALLAAAADPKGIAAVVALSAPQVLSGLAVGPDVLQRVTGAKLYIAGLGDPAGAAASADALLAMSPQPAQEEIVTDDAHGTDLLTAAQGQAVQQLIERWFARWLAAPPSPAPTVTVP
ncbi:MAG: alpha/beta fold hydrolase [Actinomycetota bacterium]